NVVKEDDSAMLALDEPHDAIRNRLRDGIGPVARIDVPQDSFKTPRLDRREHFFIASAVRRTKEYRRRSRDSAQRAVGLVDLAGDFAIAQFRQQLVRV